MNKYDNYGNIEYLEQNTVISYYKPHSWWKRCHLYRAINSFFVYQISSIICLFKPDLVDRVLYITLKEQFEGKPKK